MTPNNLVHENERLDELHRNGYYIIQDPARFCFGMDAVLLSRVPDGESVCLIWGRAPGLSRS